MNQEIVAITEARWTVKRYWQLNVTGSRRFRCERGGGVVLPILESIMQVLRKDIPGGNQDQRDRGALVHESQK